MGPLSFRRLSVGPGIGPEEKRGFAFFQQLTVPSLTEFFDTQMWEEFVLPLSNEDRAVGHALLAVSVLHEDSEMRGAPLARENLSLQRHRFALVQYTRSMKLLNQRRHSQDPQLREIILVCCLLFIICDLMRGQYDVALLHTKQGLAILEEATRVGTAKIRECLTTAFIRFKNQCFYFGLVPTCFAVRTEAPTLPFGFSTLDEARNSLEAAVGQLMILMAEGIKSTKEPRIEQWSSLRQMQVEIKSHFAQFYERLCYSESHTLHLKTKKDQRGLKIIRLLHLNYSIVLETALCQNDHRAFVQQIHKFQEILNLCKEISESFNGRKPPTLVFDTGVIAPLFYITWKCHDIKLRLQALKLLEIWPHREGPWDSRLFAFFGEYMIKQECELSLSLHHDVAISHLEVREAQTSSVFIFKVSR